MLKVWSIIYHDLAFWKVKIEVECELNLNILILSPRRKSPNSDVGALKLFKASGSHAPFTSEYIILQAAAFKWR